MYWNHYMSFHILPLKTLDQMYKALVRSHLHYCDIVKPNRLSNRLFCVRRIHHFKSFWEAPIGCVLVLKRENNAIVLASKNDVTVGYFPKFMSKLANSSLLRSVVQLQEPSSTQKI